MSHAAGIQGAAVQGKQAVLHNAALHNAVLPGKDSGCCMQIKCEEEIDTLQSAVRQVVADLMAGSHSPSAARTLLPHLPSLTHLLGPRSALDSSSPAT